MLEESFRNVIAKIFGSDENFDVIVNPDKGDFEIYRNRIVVADGEVEDENKQIALKEAQKIEADYEVGEEVSERVDFAKFGRRAILNLRQTLASKILELEHDNLYNKYKDRVGEIISGEVYQTWKREVLIVDDDNNELILPKSEQIPQDQYRKGETIKAVIARVDNENNNPKIILSRTSPLFLQRLLEAEVPEIAEGLIASAIREKDNFEEVTVSAKVPRKDKDGKRVKEVVDGKKVTVYDTVEKTIKKDKPSRLHARRKMLETLYTVTEVPKESAGKKRNTKEVDLVAKLFDEIAPKYEGRNGGYTRIVKIGLRKGDAAMEVLLELV